MPSVDEWLHAYIREKRVFASGSVFAEVKWQELNQLTAAGGSGGSSAALPSKVRTAVCLDLWDTLCASSLGHAPALQALLQRLRTLLLPAIYVTPPTTSVPLSATALAPAPAPATSSAVSAAAAAKHALALDTAALHSLLAALHSTEWYATVLQRRARNSRLFAALRRVLIPSKVFRYRQMQKRVVANMIRVWTQVLKAIGTCTPLLSAQHRSSHHHIITAYHII
jgi:hypothetical protein